MNNKISLIKASAGSGKTYDLMNRLSSCIRDGIEPENLLATTFTVKAAAELQSRIRQQLIADNKPELANRVFDGLIGTVDGICGRLLSEYSIEAGLSPALDVLPEEDSGAIFDSSLSNVFQANEEYVEKIDNAADRIGLRTVNKTEYQNADWKDDVKTVMEMARNNKLSDKELKDCAEKSIMSLKEIMHGDKDYSLNSIVNSVRQLGSYESKYNVTRTTVDNINSFVKYPTWCDAAKLSKSECAKRDSDFNLDILTAIGNRLLDSKQLLEDVSVVIKGVFDFAILALDSFQKYKESMGLVDFVDQECRTLDLFENNGKFRKLMEERLSVAMVDEFQDTSPIQLALFLKINECSENGSIWVGDPKQAIYGFRGTDSEMMNAVSSTIPKENVSTLQYSWRSKENLVRLSNEIFKRTFINTSDKEIVLDVPKERAEEAKGGDIEAWYITGKNKDLRYEAIAAGIKDIIEKEKVEPEKIGVLIRTNPDCSRLALALSKLGISASVSSDLLMNTFECRFVMAAFRYCVNPKDTAALAVLCAYYGQNDNVLNTLIKEKDKNFTSLREMPFLKNLMKQKDSTPLEIIDYVVTALEIDKKVSCMSNPTRRIQNIEKLRSYCVNYMNRAKVNRSSATPSGFISYMNTEKCMQSEGSGSGCVNVLTYHKSKGLQWPIVILCSLDNETKGEAFGAHVLPSENFDVNNPLDGRLINYWPKPFGPKQVTETLQERLLNNEFQKQIYAKEEEESRRLMYVGVTRAERKLVFAINKGTNDALCTNWLDMLSDNKFMTFPDKAGKGTLLVENEKFDITVKEFNASDDDSPLSTTCYVDNLENIECEHYPSLKSPSSISETDGKAGLIADFSFAMKVTVTDEGYDSLGNAIHNYIAINPKTNKIELASKLLKNWQVEKVVSAQEVVESTDKLYEWIKKVYPDSSVECEVPMTYTDENGTVYQGYIDMLVETADGYIIIDHKTHSNIEDAQSYAASCVGQLRLYKKAVETSRNKPVKQLIINMPTLGRLYNVS